MSDPLKSSDEFEGISEEDRREIMVEIDRVAGENRIQVTDEIFSFTPQSNGAVFPIIVNVVGILVLAGGIVALSALFRSNTEELRAGGAGVVTAESRLIEEIRRETEQLLAQKENEIAEIQEQLASINDERAALAADIEERIARREAQLQQQFEDELEAERQRLIGLNLSDAEIEERLAEFAAVKEREYAQRLEQFRRQTAAEQRRLEDELNTLETQFNQTLQRANAERQDLLAESEARLAAMQAEFEAELAAEQAQLSAAEAELARLTEQQERVELVRTQISGLYESVNTALQADDLAAARGHLRDLRALLNEESTLRIPALREQRPVELFVIESIERLISYEERFGNPETMQRLSDASLVQEVTELTEEAAAAAAAGDAARAGALYRQAIDVIPAVSASFSYIDGIADGARGALSEEVDAAAARIIADGNEALATEDWTAAIDEYARVVQSYPQSRYRSQAVAGIRQASTALADELAAQQTNLNEEIAALESDAAILQETIEATQTELDEAEAEIERLEGELADSQRQLADFESGAAVTAGTVNTLQTRVATLETQLQERNARVTELNATIDTRDQELSDTENELVVALEQLAEARTETAQAQAVIETLRQEIAMMEGDGGGSGIDAETAEELARLRALEEELAAAQNLYQQYRNESQNLVAGDTASVDVLEARVALERFLSDEAMRRLFPDIAGEVGRFDEAYVASGRENAFLDVADVLTELSFLDTAAERSAFLDDATDDLAESGGAAAAEFIGELRILLEEMNG